MSECPALVAHALKDLPVANPEPMLLTLERTKYGLRMIMLLHVRGAVPLSWLLRRIPTSPNTGMRCVSILESHGLVWSFRELRGKRRRFLALTPAGEYVASHPPDEWTDGALRFP